MRTLHVHVLALSKIRVSEETRLMNMQRSAASSACPNAAFAVYTAHSTHSDSEVRRSSATQTPSRMSRALMQAPSASDSLLTKLDRR